MPAPVRARLARIAPAAIPFPARDAVASNRARRTRRCRRASTTRRIPMDGGIGSRARSNPRHTRRYTGRLRATGLHDDSHAVQDRIGNRVPGGDLQPGAGAVLHDDRQGPERTHGLGTDPPHRPFTAADRADPDWNLGGVDPPAWRRWLSHLKAPRSTPVRWRCPESSCTGVYIPAAAFQRAKLLLVTISKRSTIR